MLKRIVPTLTVGVACVVLTGTGIVIAQTAAPAKPAADAQAAKPAADAQAAKPAAPAPKHVMLSADELKWGPAPPGLPPGAQMAVLDGDPSAPGLPFAVAAKFPDGYTVPPHWHPTNEKVEIFSGALTLGMGKTLDEATGKTLGPGGYANLPKRMPHWAKAKGETTIHISAVGPFQITYVNPKDDPRKAGTQ
jgi:hypothetical protein